MRRDAARQLAGAFEYLRPQLKKVLHGKDDGLIFQLANDFHIRHSNPAQIAGYDPRWLKWIFEIYLSTLFFGFELLGWKAAPAPLSLPKPAVPAPTFDPDEIPF